MHPSAFDRFPLTVKGLPTGFIIESVTYDVCFMFSVISYDRHLWWFHN